MSVFHEVPTATDERFRRRGPYWRPGMSVLSEPWVALAETNVGHVAVPCGRSAEHALATVHRWHSIAVGPSPASLGGVVRVAAAVVDPRGDVRESWALPGGAPPVPGGTPRWAPLHRVLDARPCLHCGEHRHAGTWVAWDPPGCALCLPEREQGDPRPWPVEASAPPPEKPKPKRVSRAKEPTPEEATTRLPVLDSPSDGRLL